MSDCGLDGGTSIALARSSVRQSCASLKSIRVRCSSRLLAGVSFWVCQSTAPPNRPIATRSAPLPGRWAASLPAQSSRFSGSGRAKADAEPSASSTVIPAGFVS
jgi:hypothetical protein